MTKIRSSQIKRCIKRNFETYEEYKLRVHYFLERALDGEIKHSKLKGRTRLSVVFSINSQRGKPGSS
ncbi:MAG: hypothetical protein PHD88_06325 [Firmicutes bacterium]|nr:hypothetical protein [Bacillota bacterium]MDD4263146.1 hypothetical protein [Bacillota bacterium]MDD4693995.1 hypothetical protein [Bacillota bacterium]